MNAAKNAIAIALGTLGTLSLGAVYSTAALAQSTPQFIERDIHQQQRIEQGLRSELAEGPLPATRPSAFVDTPAAIADAHSALADAPPALAKASSLTPLH